MLIKLKLFSTKFFHTLSPVHFLYHRIISDTYHNVHYIIYQKVVHDMPQGTNIDNVKKWTCTKNGLLIFNL